ncbi:MAG: hypothetical protein HY553_06505 [Elusimicrobia bacterium]|nr:hypothetical protein [Elusimicrobiota bacterium]
MTRHARILALLVAAVLPLTAAASSPGTPPEAAATSFPGLPAGLAGLAEDMKTLPSGTALSPDGEGGFVLPRLDGPGYWRRYTADGRRLTWRVRDEKEAKGWGPWKHEDQLQQVCVDTEVWTGSEWRHTGTRHDKTVTAKEGESWLGRTGDRVMKAPVAGKVLTFADDVAATLYTGLAGGAQVLAAQVGDRDLYSIEAGGSYAKNPVMRRLVDAPGTLVRLTPAARRRLESSVRASRARALEGLPYPIPSPVRREIVAAPIGPKEAVEVLKDGYGAGTYGKRLIAEGAREKGWKAAAYSAAGVATGTFENVAEGMLNPILWVMLGAGHAAKALTGANAAVTTATKTAGAAAGATRATAAAAWWAPWVFKAADNTGRVVLLTAEARFDQAFLAKAAAAGADAIYLFVLP